MRTIFGIGKMIKRVARRPISEEQRICTLKNSYKYIHVDEEKSKKIGHQVGKLLHVHDKKIAICEGIIICGLPTRNCMQSRSIGKTIEKVSQRLIHKAQLCTLKKQRSTYT
jgi:phospholipid N-methyltransferase